MYGKKYNWNQNNDAVISHCIYALNHINITKQLLFIPIFEMDYPKCWEKWFISLTLHLLNRSFHEVLATQNLLECFISFYPFKGKWTKKRKGEVNSWSFF